MKLNDLEYSDLINVVNSIKNEIKNTQIKTFQQVNSSLIMMYFRIGKIRITKRQFKSRQSQTTAMPFQIKTRLETYNHIN